tara:strand:- start:2160 stop:2684 length:525 start_codon:yes stop_codon:yes gene_type:complete
MSDKKDKPKLKLVSSNKVKKSSKPELTAKQLGFCKDIVGMGKDKDGNPKKPMSLVDAYVANYNVSPKTKNNTIRDMASKLKANPLITHTISRMYDELKQINKVSAIKKEEVIIRKLEEFMNNEEFSDTARVRSAELIGKSLSMFTNVTEIKESDKSSVEVEQQLREKLSKLLKE